MWKSYSNATKITLEQLFLIWIEALLTFGDFVIYKRKFHYSKYLFGIYNVNINKIFTSSKVSIRKKDYQYFLCYKDDHKVKWWGTALPKISM